MGRNLTVGARAFGFLALVASGLFAFQAVAGASSPPQTSPLATVTVTGTDNIFGAGLSVTPDPAGGGSGNVPPEITVPSGTTWMTFSNVRGTVSDEGGESNGPDGNSTPSDISGTGEISGIVDSTGVFYLVGVYLDGPQPTPSNPTVSPTSPPSLNFSGDHSFSSLSPELDQVFFIGDGLTGTGTGSEQSFKVPSGATNLYLGFADAYNWQGPTGYYGDNSGELSLTVNFSGGGDAAPIATSLGTPNQIFHSMGHNVVNAGITVAAILFITFPSTIFNQTFSANYGEILLIMASFRRRLRRTFGLKDTSVGPGPEPGSVAVASAAAATAATEHVAVTGARAGSTDTPGRSSRTRFYGVLVVGAILGGLLNPQFGLNERSLADIGATLVAFALGTLIGWFIAKTFRERHHYPVHTYLHALPLGLVVAGFCVLVSRLTNFEPGYLYGVVVSIAFVETLEERHNAHLTAISTLSTLGIALLAWFLWVPVNHFALEHGHDVILAIVDDVLASVFVGGLVGTVIGLLPLEFMPGGTLAKWRKDVWAVVFFVAIFLLVEVELRPAAGPTHPGGAPIVTALVLFAIFGGGTFWMRHFFARRKAAKDADAGSVTASAATPTPNALSRND
jgi:hypothetical protein